MGKIIPLMFLLLFMATVNIAQEIEPKSYKKVKKIRAFTFPEISKDYGNLISGQVEYVADDIAKEHRYAFFFQNEDGKITVVGITFYPATQYIPEMIISEFPRKP